MRMPERPPETDVYAMLPFDREVLELALDCNGRYLHWSELKYRDLGGVTREELWSAMKLLRALSARSISIGDLELVYNLTDRAAMALHDLDMRLAAGIVPPELLDDRRRLMYSVGSVMEEAIASSQMEGASTPAAAAKRMLRAGREPSDTSERMIADNHRAMRYVIEHSNEPLTPSMILKIHSLMTEGTLERKEDEGRFRTDDSIAVRDVYEDVTYHRPPSHGRIDGLIDGLCGFANDNSVPVHPIVKGIVLYFALAYIHPFVDGNGRVSRSLFYWYMLRSGYPAVVCLSISKVLMRHRGRYDMSYLLSETDGDDVTYFVDFNLDAMSEAADLFTAYVRRKVSESLTVLEDSRASGLSPRQRDILSDLAGGGDGVGPEELALKYMVSASSVRRDLLRIMDAGLAEQVRSGHRILYRRSV